MKKIALLSLCLGVTPLVLAADAPTQTITRAGTQPSAVGPEQNFTGRVRVERLVTATPEINASAAYVTFEPGARSAWHTHDKGQLIFVEQGRGRVQRKGESIRELKLGDSDYTAPNVVHWHGATPDQALVQINVGFGGETRWLEKVTDAEYTAKR